MFYFPIFLCGHLCSPCANSARIVCSLAFSAPLFLHSPFTKHSLCVHKVFTLCSPFIQRLLIVQSDDIICRLISINTCSLLVIFLITDEIQCKNNSQGSPYKSFILRSHIGSRCVYHSLCARVCSLFALCVHSSFMVHKRSPNSV